jgi:hypothetical protein
MASSTSNVTHQPAWKGESDLRRTDSARSAQEEDDEQLQGAVAGPVPC